MVHAREICPSKVNRVKKGLVTKATWKLSVTAYMIRPPPCFTVGKVYFGLITLENFFHQVCCVSNMSFGKLQTEFLTA